MKKHIFMGEADGPRPFSDFAYLRPQSEDYRQSFLLALDRFRGAQSFDAAEEAMLSVYQLRDEFTTMYNLCYIRHTADTRDAFYETENDFFDQEMPHFEALKTDFYRALLDSPYRPQLTARWGKQLFRIAEMSLRTFKPEVLPLLQEENQLSSEYTKRKATAQIHLRGKVYNLSSIQTAELSSDRSLRQEAAEAKWAWFADNAGEFDRIFDELVAVRTDIARQLGFQSFTGLGYTRMLRTDYDASMVAGFRRQIQQQVVPLASRLYEAQRKRLGLGELFYYDEDYRFPEGNPQPLGKPEWIIDQAGTMYRELSAETDAFFSFMRSRQLMDLVARDGKATGGYCTYIDQYGAPFIFSNFNGTSGDIDVLTHEAGHAFQVFSSRQLGISEYNWPTYEACEIHSMSMEYFTWPWMNLFFGDHTDLYRYAHLSSAVNFLPYGVAIDEFQHFVYDNPEASPARRNQAWRELEQRYLPHRNYRDNALLNSGGYWYKQSHVFSSPFYYIDYTLAQLCAFQFWQLDQVNHQQAWNNYVRLCQAGGSRSFLELVELAGLRSPFEQGCVADVMSGVEKWLTANQR